MTPTQISTSKARLGRFVFGFGVVAMAATSCSSDKAVVATTATKAATTTAAPATTVAVTTTTAAPATTVAVTTTSAAAITTTTVKPAATSTTAPASAGTNPADSSGSGDPWLAKAAQYRGQNGTKVTLDCPANGTHASIWGTETYTDDSSVCNAAVQVGLITFESGGKVEIEIAPGLDAYTGGVANGVDSANYGAWGGSFTFPAVPAGSVSFNVGPESWSRNATVFRGQDGDRITVQCSTNGQLGGVWGTGTYTDDSSICTAAVHAGIITVDKGGQVVIQIAPGQASYSGSVANGITSSSYDSFDGSYTFPKDQKPA